MTKQQKSAYKLYFEMCEEIDEAPKLTEADFTLTKQKQRQYKLYHAECMASNVEPVLANFLLGLQKPHQAAKASAVGSK